MISQTAEYALRAVVVLGSQPGRPMTTHDVARVSRVPGNYLSKVLQALGRAGLVEAHRGLRGGYVLSRALDELTVYDVVQAVDPLKRINGCPLRLMPTPNAYARFISGSMMPSRWWRVTSSRRPSPRYCMTRPGLVLDRFANCLNLLTESLARKRSTSLDCRNGRGGRLSASIGRSRTLENWKPGT